MNENLSYLHDLAMDYADEAQFALKKGNIKIADLLFEIAYDLEKQFALAFPLDDDDFQLSRSVFLRSAATLALDCKKPKEALELVQRAMNSKPHPAIVEELEDVKNKALEMQQKSPQLLNFTAKVVAFDTIMNEIKVQDVQNNNFYIVKFNKEGLSEVIQSYWTDPVNIKGNLNNGVIALEEIKKAA